jgi:hypothetical protein
MIINKTWIIESGLKGKVTITDFIIPDKVEREIKFQIYAEISESLPKGYVDLIIVGSEGQTYKDTYCMLVYKTQIEDENEDKGGKRERKIQWDVTIPKNIELGNYKVVIIIYDAETGKWLGYKEKIIHIE